jgi:hypothetical protein
MHAVDTAAASTDTPTARQLLPRSIRTACDLAVAAPAGPLCPVAAATRAGRGRIGRYRVAWLGSGWEPLCYRPLAADRRDTVWTSVRPGTLLAEFPAGGRVEAVYLVTGAAKPLRRCRFRPTGAGTLRITLPDGREVERPDPRPF